MFAQEKAQLGKCISIRNVQQGPTKYSDHSELCKVSSDTFITVQLSRLRVEKENSACLRMNLENVQSISLRVGDMEDN